MINDLDQLSINDIQRRVSRGGQGTSDAGWIDDVSEYTEAAVLLPLVRQSDGWHLLYIRRATHEHDYHSGQVAFAGGKREPEDADLNQTAVREAHEEIGLQPVDVSILGHLGPHYSISRFQITPVVAHVPWPYRLQLDSVEVARAFTIPLNWLANPNNHSIESYRTSSFGTIPVVEFRPFDGERLWGATARMTLSLLSLLHEHS
jgi:8-oxo-dGTP pyrophosphatase MutT (NUDIX family)